MLAYFLVLLPETESETPLVVIACDLRKTCEYAYQKKREAEREAELEKEREKLKKKEIKFSVTAPKKDWSIYGGWVNPFEPINKGRLGSTQEWRVEKPKKHYY